MNNKAMVKALKAVLVPALRERRFEGSFPHFRRIKPNRIDLFTVQFDKNGGGFLIEIAHCGLEGVTMPSGDHIPPDKVTAWNINPHNRTRLGATSSSGRGVWFRYDDGTPVEEVAGRVVPHLARAEEWWNR
jgi:uncharacterized protein DUF4304